MSNKQFIERVWLANTKASCVSRNKSIIFERVTKNKQHVLLFVYCIDLTKYFLYCAYLCKNITTPYKKKTDLSLGAIW